MITPSEAEIELESLALCLACAPSPPPHTLTNNVREARKKRVRETEMEIPENNGTKGPHSIKCAKS